MRVGRAGKTARYRVSLNGQMDSGKKIVAASSVCHSVIKYCNFAMPAKRWCWAPRTK